MKKLLFILLAALPLFIGCKKEVIPDLFEIPLTNWSLTKDQVLSQETRTLSENITASQIILLAYPFTDKGDGALKYTSDTYFNDITYGFYNENNTLEVVFCIYTKTNLKTTEEALQFLNEKYGEYTTKTKSPDYSGFAGKVYKFSAPFGIVVLEEYSQTSNRVIFTKSQYASSY